MCKMTMILLSLLLLFSVAGCASYYQVKDPASGSLYYTEKIDEKKGGGIVFKDAKSGSTVTLQSSEVKEISKSDFQTALESSE